MNLKFLSASFVLIAALASSLGTTALSAQENVPQTQAPKKAHATPADQLAAISARYGLSDEQKQKVSAILEEEAKESAALRKDKTLSKEDRKAKVSELHKSREEKIRAILTPEQLKKQPKAHAKKGASSK